MFDFERVVLVLAISLLGWNGKLQAQVGAMMFQLFCVPLFFLYDNCMALRCVAFHCGLVGSGRVGSGRVGSGLVWCGEFVCYRCESEDFFPCRER
jgi:hypothetical protein